MNQPQPVQAQPPLGELTAHIESNDPNVWIDSTAFMGLIAGAEVKDGKLHVEAVAKGLSLKLTIPVAVAHTGANSKSIHVLTYMGQKTVAPIFIDEAPPLLSAELAADLDATPSLPDAVGAFLKAWNGYRNAPIEGPAVALAMYERDMAIEALRLAYAQVIPS